MFTRRGFLLAGAVTTLASCRSQPLLRPYDGPEVTRVVVMKSDRRMYLMHHSRILEKYDVALGFAPEGDKQFEGDGKTPEGRYFIDRRNSQSQFHLSLGISYPNSVDVARAAQHGKKPGGDIFIHGRAGKHIGKPADWTAGCISVSDHEVEQVWSMVPNGTAIDIFP